MLALPGALSALAEVSPWSCRRGLWLQSYLEGHPGQDGGNILGTAMSGHQRGAVVLGCPLCLGLVFTDAPLCPGRGRSTEHVDRPQTGPCLSRL